MACFHPMWRVDFKKASFWLPAQYEKRVHNGGIIIQRDEADYLKVKGGPFAETSIQQIPCGKCIGCRLESSRQWADRCMLEAKKYEHSCFVTLTYDTAYLLMSPYVDIETGETALRPMLRKHDLQQFMKSLRQRFKRDYDHDGIRFYACGEYGSLNGRPHFHAILFNCDFPDRKMFKETEAGRLDTSELLSSVWGKGFCTVADVTWETCAYVARYVTKKRLGEDRKKHQEAQQALFPTILGKKNLSVCLV